MPATTKQLQIRSAVAAALAGLDVDGGVHENRDFSLTVGVMRQVHVNFRASQPLVGDEGVVFTGHPRDWRTEIELAILARKDNGVEASDVADAVWAEAYALLMADQTLSGRAMALEPGEVLLEWAEGDTSLCRLTCSFVAHHRTDNHTIT